MEVNCVLFCFLSCCNQNLSRICGDQTGIMSLSLWPSLWVSYTPTAVIPELVSSTKPACTIREPDVCFLSWVSLVFPFSGRQSCLRCTFAFILPCFVPSPTEAVGAAGSNLQRNSAVLSSSAHTGVQRMLSWSWTQTSCSLYLGHSGWKPKQQFRQTLCITWMSIWMLPGGGTFTFEENHVLGVTLCLFVSLFVEVIFLGTRQELPDSNTNDCLQLWQCCQKAQ